MKRVIEEVGLRLLRYAGYSVPKEKIKNVIEPKVLTTSLTYPRKTHPYIVEDMYEKKIEDLLDYTRGFIKVEKQVDDETITLTFTLVIQKHDEEKQIEDVELKMEGIVKPVTRL